MAGNNHIVNSTGRGGNAFSNTFHGLRRTQDGKLYYTLSQALFYLVFFSHYAILILLFSFFLYSYFFN